MISQVDFPRLTSANHVVTSPPSSDYNCIAWSAGEVKHWWEPAVFWPISTPPGDYGIDVLQQAFVALGYADCEDGLPELGFEKIALYGSSLLYTHAARQLASGKWTSKLGRSEDIEHNAPTDVAGGVDGEVVRLMKRTLPLTSTSVTVR